MKNLILSLGVLTSSLLFAAAPNNNLYPYERAIQIPSISKTKDIEVKFDDQLIYKTSEDLGKLKIIDSLNNEVQFEIFQKKAGKLKKLKPLQISSIKDGLDKSYISDGNHLSTFIFNEKIDGNNSSWVIFDLNKPTNLSQISIISNETANIRKIKIQAGNSLDTLKTIVGERDFKKVFDLKNILDVKYIKIFFWGNNIKIDDIDFTESNQISAIFKARPKLAYKILYGNPNINSKRYTGINTEIKEFYETQGYLKTEKLNPIFIEDIDEDAVPNSADNCIFKKNTNQEDIDNDQIGDVCDNAPNIKNTDQIDIDFDGVADVIDNCKYIKNPSQEDFDKDGYGDACDVVDTDKTSQTIQDNKSKKTGSVLPLFIFILLLVAGGYFGWKKYLKR